MKLKKRFASVLLISAILCGGVVSPVFATSKKMKKEIEFIKNDKSLDMENITDDEVKLLTEEYKKVTKELRVMIALNAMKDSVGSYSRLAIIGNNLSMKPIKIEFKNFSQSPFSFSFSQSTP